MRAQERWNLLLDEVNKNGQVKIGELSKRIGCSEITLRNDIRTLDQQGLLKKVYGGAVRKEQSLTISFNPGEYFLNADRKKAIAEKAYEYIDNRGSIIIDDSTTGCYLAEYIKEHPEKKVVVVTNSLVVASILSSCEHTEVFMLGGHIGANPPSSLDNITVNDIGQFHVDKAFVGINGINLELGLTSIGTPQMDTKKEMIRVANKTYVLADSSKFGTGNLFRVCTMDKVELIITDSGLSEEQRKLADEQNVRLELV